MPQALPPRALAQAAAQWQGKGYAVASYLFVEKKQLAPHPTKMTNSHFAALKEIYEVVGSSLGHMTNHIVGADFLCVGLPVITSQNS